MKIKHILVVIIIIIAVLRLSFFAKNDLYTPKVWILDQSFSLALIATILLLWDRLKVNVVGFILALLFLAMHNLGSFGFYNKSFFGFTYDIYMHVTFGVIAGYMLFNYFFKAKYPWFVLTVLGVLGMGAMHEIIELGGALALGRGEGFLLFGPGDEGSYDTVKDLTMNLFGAMITLFLASISVLFIKLKATKRKSPE